MQNERVPSGISWKTVTQNIVPIASAIRNVIKSAYHLLSIRGLRSSVT